MSNLDIIELENGLKVFLINDNTKHTTYINLIVKYGGIDNEFYIGDKKYKMKDGIAHLIEHLVLESNVYGDIMQMFGSLGIRSNGMTYIDRTHYFIDTVDHIYDGLKVLIKGIHNPIMNDEILYNIKQPILEEKRRSLDNKNRTMYNSCISSLINNKKYKTILGEIKDIENINIKDINICLEAFYRPNNEIIVIGGRFDKDKIISVIRDTYNSLSFSNKCIKKIIPIHKNEVNKKKMVIKDNTAIGKTSINFKISMLDLMPEDKLKYDMYLACFLRMNFGITSTLYNEMVDNKIICGGINYSNGILEGNELVRIESDTNYSSKFYNRVLNYINNKEYILDEELFNLYKRNFIIELVLRTDSIYDTVDPLIENIISFNFEKLDKVEDLENLNYDDFVNCIKSIDFSNYSICELRRL